MDQQLQNIFQVNPQPVLGIEKKRIVYANPAATAFYRRELTGEFAFRFVPAELLRQEEENFSAAATIFGWKCMITGGCVGPTLVLAIIPDRQENRSRFASESFSFALISNLAILKLAIEKLSGMMEPDGKPRTEETLSRLYHSYYSLRRLAMNLTDAYAMDSGTMPFYPKPASLKELFGNLTDSVSVLCRDMVSISFSCCDSPVCANVDYKLAERMLLILLANAIEAAGPGGQVQVALDTTDSSAVLSVEDSGRGIPQEVLPNLFSRYDTDLSDHLGGSGGPGLGLGIARGIALLHGGTLLITQRKAGCLARVTLPAKGISFSSGTGTSDGNNAGGMEAILTELAPLLDSSFYTRSYLD